MNDCVNKSLKETVDLFLEKRARKNTKEPELIMIKEDIINKVFFFLCNLVEAKFADYYMIFPLDNDVECDYSEDDSLNLKGYSFLIRFALEFEKSYEFDGDPIVKFVFDLNEDNLTKEHLKELFSKMEKKIGKQLGRVYSKYVMEMHRYFGELMSNYPREASSALVLENPAQHPDKYFLSHKVYRLK